MMTSANCVSKFAQFIYIKFGIGCWPNLILVRFSSFYSKRIRVQSPLTLSKIHGGPLSAVRSSCLFVVCTLFHGAF
jgi:hypothetical protein